jgi:AAA domain
MSHIIELHVENVKRIKALQIVPTANTVVVSGANDSGKTSTLDAISYALAGERELCEEPLRRGEKSGKVRIKLSEELNNVCIIERRFTPSGTVLEIKNADGVPQKTPQALLDAIIGKICFDPLTFVRLKKEPQTKLLAELVGLDFTEVNAVRAQTFQERTIRNRELDAAKAKLNAHPFNPSLPKEPLEISALALQLGEAKQKNSSVRQRKQAVEAQKQKAFDLAQDVVALTSKIQSLKKMLEESATQLEQKMKAQ